MLKGCGSAPWLWWAWRQPGGAENAGDTALRLLIPLRTMRLFFALRLLIPLRTMRLFCACQWGMHWIECPVSHGETVHTRLRSWPGLNATSRGGDATHSMHRSAATGGSSALSLFFQCLSSAPLVSLLACMRPRSISFFSFSLSGCDACLVRIVRCRSTRQMHRLAASSHRCSSQQILGSLVHNAHC